MLEYAREPQWQTMSLPEDEDREVAWPEHVDQTYLGVAGHKDWGRRWNASVASEDDEDGDGF